MAKKAQGGRRTTTEEQRERARDRRSVRAAEGAVAMSEENARKVAEWQTRARKHREANERVGITPDDYPKE
jgi:hypothetical protein